MNRLLAACCLGLCLLAPASGAPAADAPSSPAGLLARLGNERFDVRQKATHDLLKDPTITPDDLVALYASAASAEQRSRLMSIALHRTVRDFIKEVPVGTERGSLGVSLAGGVRAEQVPEVRRAAVRVGTVYPGFPAFVELQSGDLITAVNGATLPDTLETPAIQNEFVRLVQANPPGKEITLGVWRAGESLEVSLKPAPYDSLQQLYEPGAFSASGVPLGEGLREPFQQRWEALRGQMISKAKARQLPPLQVAMPSATQPASNAFLGPVN
ncbi:MAG: PDZ domain-containing protein [Planctomycetota bacterium]|nr:PDZ domain-containing protein [Planctomycetota bacterium]